MAIPKPGEIYLHFKGYKYEIIGVEKGEVKYNVLEAHDGFKKRSEHRRNLEDFCGEKVFEEDKIINGKEYKIGDKVKRFTKVEK